MSEKIYVSFNFIDRDVVAMVKPMLAALEQKAEVKWVMVENDVSYNGKTAIAWELEQLMSDCDCALIILGDNPRSSPWLDKEASHAIAREIPVLITQLPDMESVRPAFMERIDCPSVQWQLDSLIEAIARYSSNMLV